MVIDLQATPPKIIQNSRKIYPDTNGTTSTYYRDQLSIIKTNLLNPAEVKFSNINDGCENGTRRKRLTTISSEASETESFASSSTAHPSKKKIPDGGYGWVIERIDCKCIRIFIFLLKVIVFASLMVSLIADGVSFSFGLLYTELLDYFNEGKDKYIFKHC